MWRYQKKFLCFGSIRYWNHTPYTLQTTYGKQIQSHSWYTTRHHRNDNISLNSCVRSACALRFVYFVCCLYFEALLCCYLVLTGDEYCRFPTIALKIIADVTIYENVFFFLYNLTCSAEWFETDNDRKCVYGCYSSGKKITRRRREKQKTEKNSNK